MVKTAAIALATFVFSVIIAGAVVFSPAFAQTATPNPTSTSTVSPTMSPSPTTGTRVVPSGAPATGRAGL